MNLLFVVLLAAQLSTSQDPLAASVHQLQIDADRGDPRAEFWFGIAYQRGAGVEHNDVEGLKWLLKSAKAGNADAQNATGEAYEEGQGVQADLKQAAHWYSRACENRPDYGGASVGCNNLGLLYFSGKGVPQNFALAYVYARIGRNNPQAAECAKHMNSEQHRIAESLYRKWLQNHGEENTSQT